MTKAPRTFLASDKRLMSEWDFSENHDLDPSKISRGSKKKVGWICSVDPTHKWVARIDSRTKKTPNGCPYCSGRNPSASDNLEINNPQVALEWHPEKNGELIPSKVKSASNLVVWWKCRKFDDHEWQASPNSRTGKNKTGCPFCSGNIPSSSNNLGLISDLKMEWHDRNLPKQPEDFTINSGKKVWWQCSLEKEHEWEATIASRRRGSGCPFCAGKRVSRSNNLEIVFPELAREWHPVKNLDQRPKDFLPHSNKKVWWKCSKVRDHEWRATINSRTRGNGCPVCAPQTSSPEIRILTELRTVFSSVKTRTRIAGREADIVIEDLLLAIEYDGEYFHRNKTASDRNKNDLFKDAGYKVLRVRGKGLSKIEEHDILTHSDGITKSDMNQIFRWIMDNFSIPHRKDVDQYLRAREFQNEKEFLKYLSYFPKPFPENSLSTSHPNIASEWDSEKNAPLSPDDVSRGSSARVWWVCKINPEHKWRAKIKNRTQPSRSTGCPVCRKKKTITVEILDSKTGEIYHELEDIRTVLIEEGIERSLSQVNQYVLGTTGKKLGLDKRFKYLKNPRQKTKRR